MLLVMCASDRVSESLTVCIDLLLCVLCQVCNDDQNKFPMPKGQIKVSYLILSYLTCLSKEVKLTYSQ